MVTVAEWEAAVEFAARDVGDFAAEWELLSAGERAECDARARLVDAEGCRVADHDDPDDGGDRDGTDGEDRDDADVQAAVPGWRLQESGWLALAAAGGAGVTPAELVAIATAAPGSLGDPDRPGRPGDSLTQLQCLDRLVATLAGHRHAIIAHLCPDDEDTAGSFRAWQHLAEEIALATRVGAGTAEHALETARLLAGPFQRSRADLLQGSISESHVRVLVHETRNLVDDPTPHPDLTPGPDVAQSPPRSREQKLTEVQARVAAYAYKQTPGQYARTIRAAVAAVDPAGEADRHAAAKATRDVTVSRDGDGMGVLVDRDDAASVSAVHQALTAAARLLQAERGGVGAARAGDRDARIGACRADVLKTLVLGRAPAPPADAPPAGDAAAGGETAGGDGRDCSICRPGWASPRRGSHRGGCWRVSWSSTWPPCSGYATTPAPSTVA